MNFDGLSFSLRWAIYFEGTVPATAPSLHIFAVSVTDKADISKLSLSFDRDKGTLFVIGQLLKLTLTLESKQRKINILVVMQFNSISKDASRMSRVLE